jgi:hypothetical protein
VASLKKRLVAVQTDLVEKDEELKTLSEACQHGATAVKAKEREHKALLEQHKDGSWDGLGGMLGDGLLILVMFCDVFCMSFKGWWWGLVGGVMLMFLFNLPFFSRP